MELQAILLQIFIMIKEGVQENNIPHSEFYQFMEISLHHMFHLGCISPQSVRLFHIFSAIYGPIMMKLSKKIVESTEQNRE